MSSGEGENEGSRRRGGGIAGEMIKIRMTVSLDINMHSLSLFVISADGGSNKK